MLFSAAILITALYFYSHFRCTISKNSGRQSSTSRHAPARRVLLNNLSGFVHKDFLRSQSSPGSSARFYTTTAQPTKCTKHGVNQRVTSFDQNFYSIGGKISLIIHQNRIQTKIIVFNTVFKLIR